MRLNKSGVCIQHLSDYFAADIMEYKILVLSFKKP